MPAHATPARRLVLGLAALAAAPAAAHAAKSAWINADGGAFHDESNWDAGVPGAADTAVFDLDTDYEVVFESDATNDFLEFAEGDAVFDLDDYFVNGVVVGENDLDVARLTLEDGRFNVNGDQLVRLGKDAGAAGELVVSLRGVLTTATNVIVGDAGVGALTVDLGGIATTARTFVADDGGSTGTVTVDGAGSSWTNEGELFLGNFGDGELRLTAGGVATTGVTFIGDDPGSSGAVTVTGAGSMWTCDGALVVGNAATGEVGILAGGVALWRGLTQIGDDPGVTGSVEVSGNGSIWTCEAEIFVGNDGSGEMCVLAGGEARTARVKLGDEPGSDGTATVDGAGSTWTDSVEIFVGNFGTGLLTVSGGGVVNGVLATLGDDPGSDGTAVVEGAGSRWSSSGLVKNGDLGAGTIRVVGGGRVVAGGGYVQSAASRLELVLDAGSADMLDVTGTATLAGALDVRRAVGFDPPAGTMFVVLAADAIDGAFDSITVEAGLSVTVEPTRVVVEVEEGGDPCPADIDGSGFVDFDDLLAVLAAWGPCDEDCPEDIDSSGTVDFDDLLLVLAGWGPCP